MKKIIIGFFVLATFTVNAQEVSQLTFSQAVKIALENNISLKQQQNQQFVNQAQKSSSMASVAPQVSAFAQAWNVQGNQFIEQEARVVNDAQTTNFYGTVDANMILFNGFNRINAIKQADANLEAQQYLVNRTTQDVITNVSNQYLRCLLDKELLTIAEENLETQRVQLNQIQEMVDAGSRAKVDQYNQESIMKTAELTKLRAEIRLRNDLAILSQTLQLDPANSIDVEEPTWTLEQNQFESYELQQLYEVALTNRGDLLQAKKAMLSAQRGVSLSKTNSIPTLSAYGSLNSRYSDASIPTFDDQMNDNLRREYGLRLSIPIFNGLQNRTTQVRAKVNYQNAELDLDNVKNTVKSEVLRAYQSYQDAIINYEASKAQFDAAKLSLELESERYELQSSDFVQYSIANQRFIQAQADLAQSEYTLLFQDILLQYAVGTLKFEDIP